MSSILTPTKDLLEHNYCRNPDVESKGVWCYTTDSDVRWEFCSQIPDCDCQPRSIWDQRYNYKGKYSTTKNGWPCQYWNRQKPHNHDMISHHGMTDYNHNYCRNPDGSDSGLWCYVDNWFRDGKNATSIIVKTN